MLHKYQSAQDRWGGVSDLIDRWLSDRKNLLVEFCDLTSKVKEPETAQKLKGFCEHMVDYLSTGHFEVHRELINKFKRQNNIAAIQESRDTFEHIGDTTELLLDFNDKYLEVDDLSSLEADLNKLGEVLASRFDAEDVVLEATYQSQGANSAVNNA